MKCAWLLVLTILEPKYLKGWSNKNSVVIIHPGPSLTLGTPLTQNYDTFQESTSGQSKLLSLLFMTYTMFLI